MHKRGAKWILWMVILSFLAGCSGGNQTGTTGSNGNDQAGDGTELTVWAWDKNFNIPVIEKAGEYFQKDGKGDVTINVVEMSNDDVMQRLISGLTSGVSKGLPDIVLIEDYDAQNLLQNYEGTFADLTDAIDFSDFAQYKVTAVSAKDKVYGVPFDSGTAGLYYRTDYLEEAGYSEADMQDLTWSEFVDIGKAVKEKTGKWFVAFIPNRGTHYMQLAMQSAGLWYFDEQGEPFFKDNPAIREMAEILKDIDQNQLAKPVDYFAPEGIGAVTGGEVAAVNSAIWFSPTIRSAEDQKGKWAYTNIPQLETVENATPYSNLGGSSWFVLDSSPNKDAAIQLLKEEFGGNVDFYEDILVDQGAVGTYLPSQKSEAYQFEDPFFNDAPIYKDFTDWMAKIPDVNYGVNTNTAVEAIRSVLQDYFDDKLTLDQMLEQAEKYYHAQVGQ